MPQAEVLQPLFRSVEAQVESQVSARRPALILGAPGSGKTTLLAHLATRWQQEARGHSGSEHAVLFVSGRLLTGVDGWLGELRRLTAAAVGEPVSELELQRAFADAKLMLIVDGLDEIAPDPQGRFSEELAIAIERSELPLLLLSSRPVGFPRALVEHVTALTLPSMDRATTREFLRQIQPESERLVDELYEWSGGNPLMLKLLGESYSRRGQLPHKRADFYRDAIEGLLVVLTEATALSGTEPLLTYRQMLLAHGELAFAMASAERFSLPAQTVAELLDTYLTQDQIRTLLRTDTTHSLLTIRSHGDVSFSHRWFLDFFAASAAAESPERLRELASLTSATEPTALAFGLVDDPAASVIDLAEHAGLAVLRRLSPQLSDLPRETLERARRALSDGVAGLFSGDGPPAAPPLPTGRNDGGDDLLRRWLDLERSGSDGYQRGLELELFMVDFFGRFFEVVEHDFRTETGQIDLLLENVQNNPFWLGHHADIYVECKNTRAKTELSEINNFAGKLASSPATLSFFVSQAGFTGPARDRIRNAAQDERQPTIVPLTGATIRRTLEDGEEPERFFKTQVRNTRHGALRR